MNELKVFESTEFGQIRGVEINGESWLVGKDVAERLGYSNASKAVMVHVDDEDKQFEMLPVSDSQFGNLVKTALINESGLYALVLGSKLPTAKKFKRWVTADVLPAIRKHGGYLTEDKVEEALLNPDVLIRLATDLKEEREKRKALEGQITEDRPKVLFAESVSTAKTSILVSELAKLLKQNGVEMGQRRLFDWLRANGYLMKGGSSYNMPTQRAMEQSLFEIKETTINNPDGSTRLTRTPKVTGKGQIYFVNKFLGR